MSARTVERKFETRGKKAAYHYNKCIGGFGIAVVGQDIQEFLTPNAAL